MIEIVCYLRVNPNNVEAEQREEQAEELAGLHADDVTEINQSIHYTWFS
jgi:hypothetical protein